MPASSRTPSPAPRSCGGIFDVDGKKLRLETVSRQLEDPAVWNDNKRALELGKEKKQLEGVVTTLSSTVSGLGDAAELFKLAQEENDEATLTAVQKDAVALERAVAGLEFKRMFNDPLDPNNCFLDIQAGSGGVGTFAIQLAKHLGAFVATTTSAANIEWVKRLGADVVIDYKKDDFEEVLHDYDVVLNSQDAKTLAKSLRILKPGGKLISISGPPDPDFAKRIGAPWFVKSIVRLLSFGVRRRSKQRKVDYSFLFMQANGRQLREITSLIDSGAIRPVIDRVSPFESTNDAMAYVESGRAKGKVVVRVKPPAANAGTPT